MFPWGLQPAKRKHSLFSTALWLRLMQTRSEDNGTIIRSLTYPHFCCVLQTVLTVISSRGEGMKYAFLLYPQYRKKPPLVQILGKTSVALALLIKFQISSNTSGMLFFPSIAFPISWQEFSLLFVLLLLELFKSYQTSFAKVRYAAFF